MVYRITRVGAVIGFFIAIALIAAGSYLVYDGSSRKDNGKLTSGSILLVLGVGVFIFVFASFYSTKRNYVFMRS
jgi:hypothetical protein